ncbi:hypothetical protein CR513_39527, partial [Mucuna pruriens]
MTRSNPTKLHVYDPKIDRTFHRLIRSSKSSEVANSSNHKSSGFTFDYGVLTSNSVDFDFDTTTANYNYDLDVCVTKFSLENMDDNEQDLEGVGYTYVRYLELEHAQSYELKFVLIHLLSKFHGLVGEDPHKHLMKFHVVCSTMKPHGILEDYIKIKAFPFSLDGAAKDWLYLGCSWKISPLPPKQHQSRKRCVAEGNTMGRHYMTTFDHQINEQLLIPYFYEGLMLMDRNMIDAASGEDLMDKTTTTARNIISNIVGNIQQFGVRGSTTSRIVNEKIRYLVRQLDIRQYHTSPPARVCGICSSVKHSTNFTFPRGSGEADDYNQHSVLTKSTTVDQLQSNGYGQILSQTILNPKGNVSVITLRLQQTKVVQLPFPTRIVQARKFELDEELLQTFSKILKYAMFLKELCTHKRKKLKGDMEMGRNVSALIKNEQVSTLI